MENSKKILHEGILKLAGIDIPCYVLEDGTSVLSGRRMQEAMKIVDEQEDGTQSSGSRLSRYLNQKSLEPFIYKDKERNYFEPIICYKGGQRINGYEATVLTDLCDAFLEARSQIKLSQRQEIIAKQCEILIRSFAKVGIIALVDEATGYQYQREKDELQIILETFISKELLKWQKTFPDLFYFEIFRLNGWDYTVKGIKKRPGVIGTWTNKLIYDQLPEGVLEELKNKTPKSKDGNYTARFFQSLTPNIGHPALTAQIYKVIGIMNISSTWEEFTENFNKMISRNSGQMTINFKETEQEIKKIDSIKE